MGEGRAMIYRDECYRIVGACFEVYNNKGCGFLESVYQECLEIEFRHQGIPFVPQPELMLTYRDVPLRRSFRADFVCFGKIIVELKAVSSLCDAHQAQLLNYLNAAGFQLGLLINFGHDPKLEYKRMALTDRRQERTDGGSIITETHSRPFA
ncbi:MAG: GxxExxY protein [Planctomycetota bacterium]|nr:GxxExxY protein [Planctomycetaceae bacterium]MDQ3331723.1 GxxExxY protein [Planctomycetota bacterium]